MIVLIGLDNTLCSSEWRRPLIDSGGWDEYHAALSRDEPVAAMKTFVGEMSERGHQVTVVTSRPEKWRAATNEWLLRHKVAVDEVLMRPDDDYRPSPQVKTDLAVKRFGSLREVDLMVDDRDDVIAAFRSRGVYCLQFSR